MHGIGLAIIQKAFFHKDRVRLVDGSLQDKIRVEHDGACHGEQLLVAA